MQATVDQATGLIIDPTPSILSAAEESDLAEQELIIARNLPNCIAAGHALMAVQQRKLYRKCGTFQSYCRERWGFTSQRGYQLIAAAKTATTVDIANERQARALAQLTDPLEQKTAVGLAYATARLVTPGGVPTAAIIEEAVGVVQEMRATGGKVDVDGTMQAATASVVARHHQRVKDAIDEAQEKRSVKSGVVVVVLKASACRVQSVLPNGDVILHFDSTADAAKLRAMWMGRAGGNLSLKLTQTTAKA